MFNNTAVKNLRLHKGMFAENEIHGELWCKLTDTSGVHGNQNTAFRVI
jgi:hypothetical protein